MTRQTILFMTASLIVLLSIISILPQLVEMMALFIVAGQIPGTHYVVEPEWMFFVSIALIILLTAHFIGRAIVRYITKLQEKTSSFTNSLPTKRFHRIQ